MLLVKKKTVYGEWLSPSTLRSGWAACRQRRVGRRCRGRAILLRCVPCSDASDDAAGDAPLSDSSTSEKRPDPGLLLRTTTTTAATRERPPPPPRHHRLPPPAATRHPRSATQTFGAPDLPQIVDGTPPSPDGVWSGTETPVLPTHWIDGVTGGGIAPRLATLARLTWLASRPSGDTGAVLSAPDCPALPTPPRHHPLPRGFIAMSKRWTHTLSREMSCKERRNFPSLVFHLAPLPIVGRAER